MADTQFQEVLARVKVVRPDGIMVDTQRTHCWGIVKMRGKDDINPRGSYYIVPFFPRKINDLTKRIQSGQDILLDITVALPHIVLHSGLKKNEVYATERSELDSRIAKLETNADASRKAIEKLYEENSRFSGHSWDVVAERVEDFQKSIEKDEAELEALTKESGFLDTPERVLSHAKYIVTQVVWELKEAEARLAAVPLGSPDYVFKDHQNRILILQSKLLEVQQDVFLADNTLVDQPVEPTLLYTDPFAKLTTAEVIALITKAVLADTVTKHTVNHKPQGFVVTLEDRVFNVNQTGNVFKHDTSTTDITVLDSLGDGKIITGDEALSMAPKGIRTAAGAWDHKGVAYTIRDDGFIVMDGIQEIKTTASQTKGIVDENSLSPFFPETIVTWPAAMKWLPALDFIIMIGWKLAQFTMIITNLLDQLDQANKERG